MKLKTFMLALCYAIIPILTHANPERIKFNKNKDYQDRDMGSIIPVEAFWDNSCKELSLIFWDNGLPVFIEVKDEKGNCIYVNSYTVNKNKQTNIPLSGLPPREYSIHVSNEKTDMTGTFSYSL